MNISKPYYRYRPQQIFIRVKRAIFPPSSPQQEVMLPWGMKIRIDINDDIGSSIWRTGIYDIAVGEAVWRLTAPGDTAIDAGANIGYVTGLIARRVGKSGQVFAFEPHPVVYKKLTYNVEMFRQHPEAGNIRLHQLALSEQAGESILIADDRFESNQGTASLAAPGEDAEGISVKTARLDDIIGDARVSTMKIDVEGHELQVFKGAPKLLGEHRLSHIIYEDHGGAGSPVHTFLSDHGYKIFSLGWQMDGPVLAPIDVVVAKQYEPASYVATVLPDQAQQAFTAKGWQTL